MSYQDHRVLGPVTGTIAKGGITSLIGPNGAGKSTLLTVIGRLLDPTSGTVTVGGMDIRTTRSADLARHLSILRQDNHITARLTVRELVGFGRFPHSKGRLGPADTEHVDRALAFLELDGLAHRFLDQLSGGQRQRAFVAMVLAQDTDYVLLDEPLNNLDMKHSVLMMKQLRRAADELGKTIVLIVHDINFAAAYSDRIIALRDGIIVTGGTSDEMMQDHILSDVFDTSVRVHTIDGNRTAVYAR
ncbi:ATP-binding cassette domain-containing protein [Rhodococcus sp. BP-252]|nr:ATP-binding cassette domain-containing protein [Rhodococcus sp. B10]MBY6410588.1 ATP-binding cassette domain-containing protein [Rhodococcus sp. BP-320]MBY6417883.1 ATP-binding cassette domain-containing protein [Rhodococcus sp. BP-321]MBY6422878.1 ATP-binding cassette domain-containing protein [Rhodococcus sp. BP-324]MBY6425144.1 ATP-binding cassette domain-containing protein [Rhodococcus sp. BP-323]MBY6430150.1 ATP-binding cassette domain-containing protein [Rhodococcus sp. BP-322]MBY643